MFVYILHRHTCRQHPYIISLRMVEVTKTFGLGLCPPHMNVCTNIHIKILNEGIEGKGGGESTQSKCIVQSYKSVMEHCGQVIYTN